MMTIFGVDPGVTGGWAIVDELGGLLAAADLPVAGDGAQRMVAPALLAGILQRYVPSRAIVERVGSMPGQGVASTFKFGRAVGVVEGVLGALHCPVGYVAPTVWKRHYGIDRDKEVARQRAIETWPARAAELFARKRDHGIAEAALIALWGIRCNIAGSAS